MKLRVGFVVTVSAITLALLAGGSQAGPSDVRLLFWGTESVDGSVDVQTGYTLYDPVSRTSTQVPSGTGGFMLSPDGRHAAVTLKTGTFFDRTTDVVVTELATGRSRAVAEGLDACVEGAYCHGWASAIWLTDTELLVTEYANTGDVIQLINIDTGAVTPLAAGSVGHETSAGRYVMAVLCDGCPWAFYDRDAMIGGQEKWVVPEGRPFPHGNPRNPWVVYNEAFTHLRVVDLESGADRLLHTGQHAVVRFTPDGRTVYTVDNATGQLLAIDLASGQTSTVPIDRDPSGFEVRGITHDSRHVVLVGDAALVNPDAEQYTQAFLVVDLTNGTSHLVETAGDRDFVGIPHAPVAYTPTTTDPPDTTRFQGPSRIQTAVAVSQGIWADDDAEYGVVVRADDHADALAGTPLATAGGPLLLTGSDQLHPDTATELQRTLPEGSTVYILGGSAVLDPAVDEQIATLGYDPIRLAGSNRARTAAMVARQLTDTPTHVVMASLNQFEPGILGGWLAAHLGSSWLLSIDDCSAFDVDAVVIHLGDALYCDRQPDLEFRIDDGPGLSVALAEHFLPAADRVAVASADRFPDGLAGGTHAAANGMPLLLTHQRYASGAVLDMVGSNGPVPLTVYGGPSTLPHQLTSTIVAGR